jgi:hypothetical protein
MAIVKTMRLQMHFMFPPPQFAGEASLFRNPPPDEPTVSAIGAAQRGLLSGPWGAPGPKIVQARGVQKRPLRSLIAAA